MQLVRRFATAGTDLLFPPECAICRDAVCSGARICESCQPLVSPPNDRQCQICSAIVGPHLDNSEGCLHCKTETYRFRSISSLGNYEEVLRNLVLRGKYQYDRMLLSALTHQVHERYTHRFQDAGINLIIPIPHHWTDRLFSTVQASETIANELGKLLNVTVDRHILKKRECTPKQQSLSSTARRQNLKSAFHISKSVELAGARIALVDDVLTTGTTCNRATAKLREAGADTVDVVVLARGIGA